MTSTRMTKTYNHSLKDQGGFTLVEVLVSAAVASLAIGLVMTSLVKMLEISKWQSAYETAPTYF
jgi:prepilin-type N-terminal cleavage/methylation domain-containing protein